MIPHRLSFSSRPIAAPFSNLLPENQINVPSTASFTPGSLADLAQFSLERAKVLGATAAEVEISTSLGQDVTVRLGEVETIEHNRDKGLGITVYLGQHRGNASTTDLSREAIERTVKAALAIAKYTAADEFAGLPRCWPR